MKTDARIVTAGDDEFRVDVSSDGEVRIGGIEQPLHVTPVDGGASTYVVDDGHRRWQVTVAGSGDRRTVFVDGEVHELRVESGRRGGTRLERRAAHAESLSVPMPAKVVAVLAVEGQAVKRGEVVITLEAMKMQLPLRAPRDGVVRSVSCREGDLVQPGAILLEIA